ncbi:unnamed protein product, partial [Prorocentrum cordatum]
APVRTHRAAARGTRGLVVPSGGGVDGGPGWRGHGPALGGSAAVAGQLDLQLRRAEACGRPPGVQSVGARRGQLLLETAGFLFWGFTGELVCFLAGLVYPMWASFRVLEDFHEDPAGGAPEEWLAYWVSHTALTLLECVLRRFLELIPFYYPLRLLFIVWMFHPESRGAAAVYRWAVAPALRLQRPAVDAVLAQAAARAHEALGGELREGLCEGLRSAAASGVGYVRDLGVEDLMAQELKKAAAAHLIKTAGQAVGPDAPRLSSARTRADTPPPRPCSAQQASQEER